VAHEHTRKATLTVKRRRGLKGVVGCSYRTEDDSAVAPQDYISQSGKLCFEEGVTQQTIEIALVDDFMFESDEVFKVYLENPTGGAIFKASHDGGLDSEIAEVTIRSDDERRDFVDSVSSLLHLNVDKLSLSSATWYEQFREACAYDSESGCAGLLMHLIALPWKLLAAFVPPPILCGGYLCFLVALALIGGITALISDLADQMGCCMGLAPSITAITFVALGTSLPDTFASKTAAINERHADASIGNITGSNSDNVFLGLGFPWAAAALYWAYYGALHEDEWRARYSSEPWYYPGMPVAFAVPGGDLGFSVSVFSVLAIFCLFWLVARRALIGVELGGPDCFKYFTGVLFVCLWLVYIGLSIANTQGLLDGLL